MSITHPKAVRTPVVLLSLLLLHSLLAFLSSCGDGGLECSTAEDCEQGAVCVNGLCIRPFDEPLGGGNKDGKGTEKREAVADSGQPDLAEPTAPDGGEPAQPDRTEPGAGDEDEAGTTEGGDPGSPDSFEAGQPDSAVDQNSEPGAPDQTVQDQGTPDRNEPGQPDQPTP